MNALAVSKALFVAGHFGALLLLVASCWGLGRVATHFLPAAATLERGLRAGVTVLAGLGMMMTALLFLAWGGRLRSPWIFLMLASGWCATVLFAIRAMRLSGALRPRPTRADSTKAARARAIPFAAGLLATRLPHWSSVLVVGVALCTCLAPLQPPHRWDELAYHLPHARQWAESGLLSVTPWLRYPWFPFDYHLLYAASLVVYDDVFPHLLNALSGWLIAFMLCRAGIQHGSRIAGAAAAVLWLLYSRDGYADAYVDFGAAAFVTGALILLAQGLAGEAADSTPVFASFLMGAAVGTKYQALVFVPLLCWGLTRQHLSRKQFLQAAVAFALPSAYWYLRNAVATGDPFDPLGGRVFGFHDWNLADYQYQLLDVEAGRGWPSPLIWPALASPLLLAFRSTPPAIKRLVLFGAYGAAAWYLTSRFPRYFIATAPLACLLASWVVWLPTRRALGGFAARLTKALELKIRQIPFLRADSALASGGRQALAYAVVVAILWHPIRVNLVRDWNLVAADQTQRQAFLSTALAPYRGVLTYLDRHPGLRIYQKGLEAALYYARHPIYGDHFGPWRYRDFLVNPPALMAQKLRDAGLDTLVVQVAKDQEPLNTPGFADEFSRVYRDPIFHVYALKRR